MDEKLKIDVSLISTCHGCLSSDRTITQLGDNADMLINLLGVHRQCLVYGLEDIKLCWECMAILTKFKCFQNRVRTAQAGLMKLLYEIDAQVTTLSKLTTVNKYYYDQNIKHYRNKKLKKNNEQLDTITIIKTEFEDIQSYSDEDTTFGVTDTKVVDKQNNKKVDNKFDKVNNKFDKIDSKLDEVDNQFDEADNKPDTFDEDDNKDAFDDKDLNIKSSLLDIDFPYEVKDEDLKAEVPVKSKKPRRQRDTQCVNNVVGYYKKYATLVKKETKDWGSWEAVRAHFKLVQLSEQDMEEHFLIKDRRNTSHERMPYKCDDCTLGYLKEDDLNRHRDLNHHEVGVPFKCTMCSKRFSSHGELDHHWRSHSAAYRCRSCGDVCKENFMRKHLNHAHTKTYDCNVCHHKFGTLKSFTLHYKEMHMTYVCDHCGHTLTTKKKMEKHISEHHMTYTCKDCNRTYKNYIYYKKHCYSLHPDKVKSKINPELSFCVECNKQFPSIDKYKTHLRVSSKHNKKRTVALPCPDCGRVFGRKKNLSYHYNLFHLKKTKYYCDICDKYFARPSGLRTHRDNVHLKIEKVKDKICDLCGRAFASHVVLRHHRRTHTGERPHKCPYCATEFIQKYAMKTHVRTQHKELAKDMFKETPFKEPVKKANVVPTWTEAGYFV